MITMQHFMDTLLSNKYKNIMAYKERDGKDLSSGTVAISSWNSHVEVNKTDTYRHNTFSGYILRVMSWYNCNVTSPMIQWGLVNQSITCHIKQNITNMLYKIMMLVCMQAAKGMNSLLHNNMLNRLSNNSRKKDLRIRDVTASNSLTMTNKRARSSRISVDYMKGYNLNMLTLKNTYCDHRKYSTKIKQQSNDVIKEEFITKVLNNKLLEKNKKNNKYYNTLNITCDMDFLVLCYDKIKSKPGNMSSGVDNETLDEINLNYFNKTSEETKSGKFNFKAGRSSMIPKKEPNKFRMLTVVSPRDKMVHTALIYMLNAMWEPTFSNMSYGFRPNRSTHSALLPLYLSGNRYNWVIQGDITKCFDNIPHNMMMKSTSNKIGDPRLLELLNKYTKAGYVLDGKVMNKLDKGVPQGGALSPLLANMVFDKFDKYIENYINKFNIGKHKKTNRTYANLRHQMKHAKTSEEMRNLKLLLSKTPSVYHLDSNYKRMTYIRYADDFLMLMMGNINDAKKIKLDIKEYLKTHCGSELNEEKTLMTNMKKKFYFLGAEMVKPRHTGFSVKRGNQNMRIVPRMFIKAPIDKLINKLLENGFMRRNKSGNYFPLSKGGLTNLDHYSMMSYYSSKMMGTMNYYSFASNYNRTRRMIWYTQSSCAYTLAQKYKMSAAKVYKKFGSSLKCPETDIQLSLPKDLKATHKFKNTSSKINPMTLLDINWSGKLTERTFGRSCMLCGSKTNMEMHHLRSVKDVRHKMRTGNSTYDMWTGGG
uniref:Reverse transcriptase domain-containing protein n=1 Tax=Magnusiomyces paraingens TaxID=2606893 RepID=A0A8E5J664_9ASCO|nr:hypothetical protein LI423_mgp20 [Saprochaete ingens]QUX32936.1 hypothetical protein [Saprochaete ingens]